MFLALRVLNLFEGRQSSDFFRNLELFSTGMCVKRARPLLWTPCAELKMVPSVAFFKGKGSASGGKKRKTVVGTGHDGTLLWRVVT